MSVLRLSYLLSASILLVVGSVQAGPATWETAVDQTHAYLETKNADLAASQSQVKTFAAKVTSACSSGTCDAQALAPKYRGGNDLGDITAAYAEDFSGFEASFDAEWLQCMKPNWLGACCEWTILPPFEKIVGLYWEYWFPTTKYEVADMWQSRYTLKQQFELTEKYVSDDWYDTSLNGTPPLFEGISDNFEHISNVLNQEIDSAGLQDPSIKAIPAALKRLPQELRKASASGGAVKRRDYRAFGTAAQYIYAATKDSLSSNGSLVDGLTAPGFGLLGSTQGSGYFFSHSTKHPIPGYGFLSENPLTMAATRLAPVNYLMFPYQMMLADLTFKKVPDACIVHNILHGATPQSPFNSLVSIQPSIDKDYYRKICIDAVGSDFPVVIENISASFHKAAMAGIQKVNNLYDHPMLQFMYQTLYSQHDIFDFKKYDWDEPGYQKVKADKVQFMYPQPAQNGKQCATIQEWAGDTKTVSPGKYFPGTDLSGEDPNRFTANQWSYVRGCSTGHICINPLFNLLVGRSPMPPRPEIRGDEPWPGDHLGPEVESLKGLAGGLL